MKTKFASVVSPAIRGLGLAACLLALLFLFPSPSVLDALGTGDIAGRVYDSADTPLANANVWAEPYDGGPGGDDTQADADGYYTLTVETGPDYRVGASKAGYAIEFYNNTFSRDDAERVGVTRTGIDFYLDPGGAIAGTVMDVGGTTPITNAWIDVSPADGALWGFGAEVDETGVYTIEGVPAIEYKVRAEAPGYPQEFYQGKADWDAADIVTVAANETRGNVDFTLAQGGAIVGTVTQEGTGNPIVDLHVFAEDNNTGRWVGGANTDESGVYTITLPSGTYRVGTCSGCSRLNYIDKYYDDVMDADMANQVLVQAPDATGSIDFVLGQGGTITGTVTDADTGAPITNASVNANPTTGEPWGRGANGIDSTGVYTISGLPPGTYKVEAREDGYPQEYFQDKMDPEFADVIVVTASQTRGNVDFTLDRGGAIVGTVTQEGTENRIVDLQVFAEDPNTGRWVGGANTDESGVYTITLPSGSYRVGTCSGCSGLNYIDKYYDDVMDADMANQVLVQAPDATGPIDFVLNQGGTITGTVTDADTGAPITNASVNASPTTGEPWGRGANGIDSTGVYTISGLPPGTYKVEARADGYPPEFYQDKADWDAADIITVTANQTRGAINFALDRGGAIVGTVMEEGNENPIANLHVYAEDNNTGRSAGGANTDESGVYTITLPSGTYRVGTCSGCSGLNYMDEYYDDALDPYMATPVSVQAPSTTAPIDFALSQGGTITGRVTDAQTGAPITEANIHASPATGEPWGRGANEIDSTGVYTIAGLPPGSYKVEARADGYDVQFYTHKTDWGFADEVEVTAGGVTGNVDFALQQEQGGEIFGRVVEPDGEPVPWAWVGAESFDHMHHKGNGADEHGNFRIGGLPDGDWLLRAYPPGDPAYADYSESLEMQVSISAASSITLSSHLTLSTVNVVGRVVLPDGSTGVGGAGVDIHNADFSLHKGTGTDHDGRFRMGGLPAGDYKLELHLPWGESGIVPPPPTPVSITDTNVIVRLGDIAFVEAVKHIVGRVVLANPGEGVPNVEVNASRRGMGGWAWTQTDESGDFSLDVAPGTWEVMIHPAPAPDGSRVDWVYSGHPKLVAFADDTTEETRQITFTVESADAQVTGRVEGPDGEPLRPWAGWVDVRSIDGKGNGMPLSANGRFTVPVTAGTYNVWIGVDERTYPDWTSPRIPPFSIASGEIKDLGTIRLIGKNSAIEGRVTRASDGAGVADLWVHAWQHEGGWGSTTTDASGNYHLSVVSGTWEVDIEPPYTSTYVTGQPPQRVEVPDGEVVPSINFTLTEASGVIQGTLYSAGELLTDVDGWAYARQGNAPEPIAGAPVINGQFSINVPHGTYRVGLWLPPNSGYTAPSEQEVGPLALAAKVAQARTRAEVATADMSAGERSVSVQAGSTVQVTFDLLPNDAYIVGAFYVDDAKTMPATGLTGDVFAMSGMGGAWQAVPIDPTDGSFELQVAAGAWNVGYWLMSEEYVNSPPPDTRVTIDSGETFVFNFTVVVADATIEGVIEKPNGDPLNYAWAWAHRERTMTGAAIDTGDDSKPPEGRFEIRVPSGGQYEVGAHAPEEWGYIQPDFEIVTPTAGLPASVVLRFKESNAIIDGTVYYHDDAGNEYYGPWAWVWAWSDDGQHTGAPTDTDGNYRLNVVKGTTWHVGASYHPEQGSLFYETTAPTDIVMNSDHESADLHLYLASTALPPAAVATFDPSIGWTGVLSDGTRIEIPAGAMPTTDTVRISVTPLVEELQNTLTARPFGFGYAIAAYQDSTGSQIVQSFNANVLITFYYTEDELQQRGVTEDNLSPAYFSTTTNSWTKAESYSADKTTNRLTVQINHFSTWALTSPARPARSTEYKVYLPLVLR